MTLFVPELAHFSHVQLVSSVLTVHSHSCVVVKMTVKYVNEKMTYRESKLLATVLGVCGLGTSHQRLWGTIVIV